MEDIYATQSRNKLSKRGAAASKDSEELFTKIHDVILSLPTPLVDRLKLRKRVPVVIKMHQFIVKILNDVLPKQVLDLDRNISLMLLPLIILCLSQIPSMIWQSFIAILGLAPVKTQWTKSSSKAEFIQKFSFDQVDQ